MHSIDSLLDVGRVLIFVLSTWCTWTLLARYRKNHDKWNTKTTDYWYALLMWCVSGMVLMAQGIILNRGLTPGTVVVVAAVLVTGKGLHKPGAWGGDE